MDMEVFVSSLMNSPLILEHHVETRIGKKLRGKTHELVDVKLKTAMAMSEPHNREKGAWRQHVFESNAAQDVGSVVDANNIYSGIRK